MLAGILSRLSKTRQAERVAWSKQDPSVTSSRLLIRERVGYALLITLDQTVPLLSQSLLSTVYTCFNVRTNILAAVLVLLDSIKG